MDGRLGWGMHFQNLQPFSEPISLSHIQALPDCCGICQLKQTLTGTLSFVPDDLTHETWPRSLSEMSWVKWLPPEDTLTQNYPPYTGRSFFLLPAVCLGVGTKGSDKDISFYISFSFSFLPSSFRYLLISVTLNTTHQPDFMHLEREYFLVKWKIVCMASGRLPYQAAI